jgi:phage tail-like protein
MAISRRDHLDPYMGFRFRVDIDDITIASFKKVTIPSPESQVKEYREGGDTRTSKLAGISSSSEITLEKGLFSSMDLYNWYNDVLTTGAIPNRKNMTITVVDEEGTDGPSWTVENCWPSKLEYGELDATNDEPLAEIVTIVHEGVKRVT